MKGKTLIQIFMAENGRKGGSATTAAKARAARRNGRKGGRPKKPNAERKKVAAVGAKTSCPKRKKENVAVSDKAAPGGTP